MRTFKVGCTLRLSDQPNLFSINGKFLQDAKRHHSLRGAEEEAELACVNGWWATIYRRVPGGWKELYSFEPEPTDDL
jgi:hypothetical protein